MKKQIMLAFMVCAGIALWTCSLEEPAPTLKDYRGASPLGDYIGVQVDMSARRVSFQNYTLNMNYGPYSFTKLTDPVYNMGFNIIYQTGVIPEYPVADCYARFAIMEDVTLVYQMMNNHGTSADLSDDTTEGFPSYAYMYTVTDIASCKGTAYTFMEYQMGNGNDTFGSGMGAFDTDNTGKLYQAVYSSSADARDEPGRENGMQGTSKINPEAPSSLNDFTFNPAVNAYCFTDPIKNNTLTLIPTASGDLIIDHGPNQGAGFAIRQAASKDWQSSYNGTFLLMVYEVENGGSSVKTMKMVLSGNGTCQVFDPSSATPAVPVFTGNFISLEDFNDGPDGQKYTTLVRENSGCDNAVSNTIKNAYNLHGGFVSPRTSNGNVDVTIMFDPLGRYFYFTSWISLTRFNYGYGIKDQP